MDKTALLEKIEYAQGLNEEDYTEESWANLVAALQDALAVYEDEEATQEEVDTALAALIAAIEALVPAEEEPGEVDKTELGAKIDEALELNEEDYTEESWANLQAALIAAVEVYNDENATQEEVDAALAALIAAIEALVPAEEEPEPEPEIIATYHPSFIPTFGFVTVQVNNLEGAAKFSVVYHLSDNPDGTPNIRETDIVDIDQQAGLIFYDPNQYNTVDIKIFDAEENLIYTFTNVLLVVQ
ncbi:MAG TPA: hypothetical protein GXX53_08145 [Tissierellia bacterium]|nr:hypothetical protein [Tissierellia bacterium]